MPRKPPATREKPTTRIDDHPLFRLHVEKCYKCREATKVPSKRLCIAGTRLLLHLMQTQRPPEEIQ
jgi:hypothetical protein